MVAQTFRQQVSSFNERILKHLLHAAEIDDTERPSGLNTRVPISQHTGELEHLDTFLEVEAERYSAALLRRACTDSDVEYGSYPRAGPIARRKRNTSRDDHRSQRSRSTSRCPTIVDGEEFNARSESRVMPFLSRQDEIRTHRSRSGSRCATIVDGEEPDGKSDGGVVSFVSTQTDFNGVPQTDLEDINAFIADVAPGYQVPMNHVGEAQGAYMHSTPVPAAGAVAPMLVMAWPYGATTMVTPTPGSPTDRSVYEGYGGYEGYLGYEGYEEPTEVEGDAGGKSEVNSDSTQIASEDPAGTDAVGMALQVSGPGLAAPVAPGRVLPSPALSQPDPMELVSAVDDILPNGKPRTTIMMRNLPNDYTRDMVLQLLDSEGFKGDYDFVYVPRDFRSWAGLGYAFVNLVSSEAVLRFRSRFNGFCGWVVPSQKVCQAAWGEPLQGLEEHIERYRNSSVMHEDVPDDLKPMLFENGERISFPPPTKRIRPMRIKHRC